MKLLRKTTFARVEDRKVAMSSMGNMTSRRKHQQAVGDEGLEPKSAGDVMGLGGH